MVQKDLMTRVIEIIGAWERMRPHKKFFGLSVEDFRLRAKPFLDARAEIARLEALAVDAASVRDQAALALLHTVQGVIQAVGGDPEETHNGELYGAMGYIPKNQRATGLTRRRKAGKAAEGGVAS